MLPLMHRRIVSSLAATALAASALTGGVFGLSSASATQPSATVHAAPAKAKKAKKPKYQATVKITQHGIPHITAKNFPSLGYGAGWAVMNTNACLVLDSVITARGDRSRYFGPDTVYDDGNVTMKNYQLDTLTRDMHARKVVEKLLKDPVAGPSARAKGMVAGEAAGIDKWLRTHTVSDPTCAGKPWVKPNVTALDVWYLVYQAQLIASTLNVGAALVDPPVPTASPRATAAKAPTHLTAQQKRALEKLTHIDTDTFGSNATAVGKDVTSTGEGMVLGNPHFPWYGRYRFTQQQLTIPGKYNVAGGSLIGFSGINIGWNKNVAWSHTVSTAARFTFYQYTTAGSPTTYWRDVYKRGGGQKKVKKHLQKRVVKVPELVDGKVTTATHTLYRTPEGYLIYAPSSLLTWSDSTFWTIRDANAEHLRTFDTFVNMGFAKNVSDLIKRQDQGGGMPWVNTMAADRDGNVLYADHSVTPHVTDAQVDACLTPLGSALWAQTQTSSPVVAGLDGTRAATKCAWGTDKDSQHPGVFGPKEMPSEKRTDWIMNANDSYWLPNPDQPLTGYPRIIGCESCTRSLRTQQVAHYIIDDIENGVKETPEIFAGHEFANVSLAATRANAGGNLDTLCAETGESDACQILHDWDGTYQATSVGPILFQKFISLGGSSIWQNPWSAADPLNTPNTLKTDDATAAILKQAIDSVRADGNLDQAWGTYNYRLLADGTRIPLGGGPASAGLANVTNGTPVNDGSSHIQAIAFLPGGGVEARTMLTYSQSTDPTSPYYSDQTQDFSNNTWETFAWTPAQIQEQLVTTVNLKEK